MNKIEVLPWPAKSPDLNIIENLWGILARAVYANGRQFDTKNELTEAILKHWREISQETIQNLYNSIPNRLVAVLEKNGGPTKY